MEDIVNIIVNNSASLGCLIYFMWYNTKHAERTNALLEELRALMEIIIHNNINKDGE